jgi:hypothetical protein
MKTEEPINKYHDRWYIGDFASMFFHINPLPRVFLIAGEAVDLPAGEPVDLIAGEAVDLIAGQPVDLISGEPVDLIQENLLT